MSSTHSPVTLPNTQVRLLKSSIVNDTYRLHISLPITYANSDKTYPVVYLTDGNGLFPLVRCISEALSGGLEIPRLILVGIGYDTDEAREWGRYRERDLLPTNASARDASWRQEFHKNRNP
jgi:predicted alpha/beta superfamily hydrolase